MISNDLIGYYVNHEEFVCANNVLREHKEMKEKNKNHETAKKKKRKILRQRHVWRNDAETIADSNGILWLNEKQNIRWIRW